MLQVGHLWFVCFCMNFRQDINLDIQMCKYIKNPKICGKIENMNNKNSTKVVEEYIFFLVDSMLKDIITLLLLLWLIVCFPFP